MTIKYSDFESSLQKRKFHSNYFLFGADAFLLDRAKQAFLRAVEEDSQGQPSQATLDLDNSSVDELLNAAQSLSMFAPRQLIFVKGVMKLRENQGKKLATYFGNPNPQTIVIFLAGDLDRDQRKKKIFDILVSGAHVVELAVLGEREVRGWIEQELKSRSFSMEKPAVDFLLELQGVDLGRLTQELEKAVLYAGSERTITLDMIEAVSGFAAGHTLSEFLDAVSARDKRKSLELIDEIFFTGKETGLAFWWFGQQLRQWLQFNELAGKMQPAIIGKQVGVYHPDAATKMMSLAKRFSRPSLIKALNRLAEVDHKMKRSSVDTRFTMELLIHDLTGQ